MEWLAHKRKAITLIFIVFSCALILVSYKISTIPKHKDPTCIMLNAIKDNNISISEGFEIVNTIHKECYANNVPIPLVLAMIDVESSFRSKVISNKKAHGLMQIRKEAWDDAAGKLGIFLSHRDSLIPHLNIAIGTFIIGELIKDFSMEYSDKDMVLKYALASYYQGKSKIKRSGISRVSEYYYNKVMKKYKEYEEKI